VWGKSVRSDTLDTVAWATRQHLNN